ncbi:hypothetical protein L6452_05033 [Arctium lappa]|uniref:Uncharacterized protein n=1 Tax=Arctium lappa TaxID=4217 RepID=A0ACB9EEU7_ARCLA|nr:hypothetical protein L6452_05033 [Arctium lappa]
MELRCNPHKTKKFLSVFIFILFLYIIFNLISPFGFVNMLPLPFMMAFSHLRTPISVRVRLVADHHHCNLLYSSLFSFHHPLATTIGMMQPILLHTPICIYLQP